MVMKAYTPQHASSDLAVINWLLKAGAITNKDANDMRKYVQSLL
jgi:hypothetical protein